MTWTVRATDPSQFLELVEVRPTGCCEWVGSKNRKGYGNLTRQFKNWKAHRYAWHLFVGPIPKGLQIDHLCRNKACVNVFHMELVTNAENVARAKAHYATRTHCKRGHAYAEHEFFERTGERRCRACYWIAHRAYEERKRMAVAS